MKNKKLKIDVVNRYFYPVTAGIETCLLETYPRLKQIGWDVTIHVSQSTLTQKNCLPRTDNVKNIPILRYPLGKFGFFPKIDWANTDIVSLNNFDVFPHFQILVFCLFLKLLGKKKFALILAPHGGFTPEWSIFSKIQTYIKKTYHFTLGTMLINLVVDKIQAVSEWENREIISHGVNPNLIKVINNGVEHEAFVNLEKLASKKIKSVVSENKPYIIQIGRIHPIKNYETTIKALAKLPKNLNYLIVGPEQNKEYKLQLEKLIKKLDLSNQVKFLGVVKGVDKYYLLKQAEMMVHMATWEAYCNTVHEGMSQGLVCIVSKDTALEDLIVNGVNGYCLYFDDYEGLARKIEFVLKNKNSAEILEMKKRNKDFAASHSWQNAAEKIERFYLEILAQK